MRTCPAGAARCHRSRLPGAPRHTAPAARARRLSSAPLSRAPARTASVSRTVRIASGSGFWGDLPRAPIDQARRGPIDYLVLDYLAEVTMSILKKQRRRDPAAGYAADFVDIVRELLPDLMAGKFRLLANAGGVNPEGCAGAILAVAKEAGVTGLKVGVVTGDDLLDDIDQVLASGAELRHLETDRPVTEVQDRLVAANAYTGAPAVAEALAQGAHVVVTGRVADPSLTLAALAHEFGWAWDDWDRMAAGTVAGHLLECGAQASGGNFTDWQYVPDFADIGFPICEVDASGDFTVTKHDGTGGLVSRATVAEQLVYEIGDPANYPSPDVVVDFTSLSLDDLGNDQVRVTGVKGKPATDHYKVSASYADGFKATSTLVYSWPDAAAKAHHAAEILAQRLDALGLRFDAFRAEVIGAGALLEHPELADGHGELDEVMLRVSARSQDHAAVARFAQEVVPLILTGPGGVTGYAGGRAKPSSVLAYWPALVPKDLLSPKTVVLES